VTGQVTVLQSIRNPLVEVSVRRIVPVLIALLLLASPVHAQESTAGATYTVLSLSYPDQIPNGFGGWYSRDLTSEPGPTLGFDAAANFFPENHPIIGRQFQLFGGVRGGLRMRQFGAFGRLRPGLMYFTTRFLAPETTCIAIFPTPDACLIRSTNLAFDLGGTFEYYPTERFVVRADLGDTVIRFRRTELDAVWQRNLQFSAGGGIRF
jgi:hypothetical protein